MVTKRAKPKYSPLAAEGGRIRSLAAIGYRLAKASDDEFLQLEYELHSGASLRECGPMTKKALEAMFKTERTRRNRRLSSK